MSILTFDVETTGLNLNGIPSDDPRQPDIVSLSAILDDADGKIISEMNVYNRDARDSDPGAFAVHGITKKQCEAEGIPRSEMIDQFLVMAKKAEAICAFNAHFDVKLIKIACARFDGGATRRAALETMKSVCAMEAAANFLIGKKRISLKNAYFDLFKMETQTEKFHGSMKDAQAARAIYYELKKRGASFEIKPILRTYDQPYEAPLTAPVGKSVEAEL